MSQEPRENFELVIHCPCGSADVEVQVTYRLPHIGAVAPLRYRCLACGQEAVDPAGRRELWELIQALTKLEEEYAEIEARNERA